MTDEWHAAIEDINLRTKTVGADRDVWKERMPCRACGIGKVLIRRSFKSGELMPSGHCSICGQKYKAKKSSLKKQTV